jgi:hypothetical protein|tara:strand:+ start:848 stop:1060 length:213 start_codon:yes stop_codon:yes gene_type:complete
MGDVVNLNRFRKNRDRKKNEEDARNNRIRYGRTGQQKKLDRAESERNKTEVEQKKLIRDDEDGEDPPAKC